MKAKHIIILFIPCLISLQSCAQKEAAMNKIANLYKEVQYRDQAISYQAKYFIGGCNFELLINGFPVERYYGPGDGSISASAPINAQILKSGTQTWEIRVYPVHINGIPQPSISAGARVELSIQGLRFKENGDIKERVAPAMTFVAPLSKDDQSGKNVFADAGKPYMSYKGTFEADVPYTLTGWNNGTPFDPADSNALKSEVLARFNEARNMIINQKGDEFQELVLGKEKEVAQALFMKEAESKKIATFYSEVFNGSLNDFSMVPIDNVQLAYYADNKVVTLLFTEKKCPNCKGEDALVGRYKDGDRSKVRYFNFYMYRPKDKKELEVIR